RDIQLPQGAGDQHPHQHRRLGRLDAAAARGAVRWRERPDRGVGAQCADRAAGVRVAQRARAGLQPRRPRIAARRAGGRRDLRGLPAAEDGRRQRRRRAVPRLAGAAVLQRAAAWFLPAGAGFGPVMGERALRMTPLLAALALAALAGGAAAQSHSVRIGGTYIDAHSTTPPLSGAPVPDAEFELGHASPVTFGYAYQPDDTWQVQFALGVPPRYKVYGRGFLQPFGQIASVKEIAPTVFVDYRFAALAARWRPFVGLGLNYTRFTG